MRQDIKSVIQHNTHIHWDAIVLWSEDMVSTARWLDNQDGINSYWIFDKPVINPFNFFQGNPEHIERFVSTSVIKEVFKIIRKSKYSVIVLNGIYSGALALLLHNDSRPVVIYRSHNIEHLLWQQVINCRLTTFSQVPLSFYALNEAVKYRSFERAVWQQVDEIWSIGYHDTLVIRKENRNVKWVLPEFSYSGSEKGYTEPDGLTAFLLTSYQWFPNKLGLLFWLKNIFPKISKSLSGWKFIIGGLGTEALRRFAKENLEVVGWINNPGEYFVNFSVFFVPVWISSGVRVKIIEAALHGKVIVSTFEGIKGLPLVKWKHYIPVDKTPQSWIKAFKWIEHNREEARQIATRGRRYIIKLLREYSKQLIKL